MKPLAGLRVLDLTRLLPGAVATSRFVEWGAEVIKVEQPGAGDYARSMNPELFARTNGGKKSIAIDLKSTAGRDTLLKLARMSDILIEGNRPGVMAKLGLAYPEVSAQNQRIVYVSLTGYGQNGRFAHLAGHDINYIALGGLLSLNLPVIPGVQIGDLVGGSMQVVIGVLLALEERHMTGKGRYVDVSMLDGVLSLLPVPLSSYTTTGQEPKPGHGLLNGAYACYNVYRTAEGGWVAVGALEPKFWRELCTRLECPELIAQQFAGEQASVKEVLAAIFVRKTAATWFEELGAADCCVTPVRSIQEIAAELPVTDSLPPPGLGEHTTEVLSKLGFTPQQIEVLIQHGAVFCGR